MRVENDHLVFQNYDDHSKFVNSLREVCRKECDRCPIYRFCAGADSYVRMDSVEEIFTLFSLLCTHTCDKCFFENVCTKKHLDNPRKKHKKKK